MELSAFDQVTEAFPVKESKTIFTIIIITVVIHVHPFSHFNRICDCGSLRAEAYTSKIVQFLKSFTLERDKVGCNFS